MVGEIDYIVCIDFFCLLVIEMGKASERKDGIDSINLAFFAFHFMKKSGSIYFDVTILEIPLAKKRLN